MRRFRVGTFNVKNLAMPGFQFYGKSYNQRLYDRKIAWTGRTICDLNAHVIGFQEVWNDKALEEALDVVAELNSRRAYKMFEFAGEDGSGPRVAIASRLPFVEPVQAIRQYPHPIQINDSFMQLTATEFRRPVLRAVVEINEQPITIFVAHLKSKRPTYSKPEGATYPPEDDLRTADLFQRTVGTLRSLVTRACEAAALRGLVIEETRGKKRPVIVLGDLNDDTYSVTTDMVAGEDPFRQYTWLKKPGSDERYSREEDWAIKRRLWDVKLYSAQQMQNRRSLRNPIYTHIYNGRYESLDHIFVSEEFFYRNTQRLGDVEYLHCFNDHLTDESIGGEVIFEEASDHAPLVATLVMRDF